VALTVGTVVWEADEDEVFYDLPMGTIVLEVPSGYFVRWDGDFVTDGWIYTPDRLVEVER